MLESVNAKWRRPLGSCGWLLVSAGLIFAGGPFVRPVSAQQDGSAAVIAPASDTAAGSPDAAAESFDAVPAAAASDATAKSDGLASTPADVDVADGVASEALSPGWDRRETLLASLTIFVLAVFLGFELITKVPPTLHTPLMSGSNAISGITLVGAVLAVGVTSDGWLIPLLGTLAVIMATVNAVGGFAVTHRMLAMFRRK